MERARPPRGEPARRREVDRDVSPDQPPRELQVEEEPTETERERRRRDITDALQELRRVNRAYPHLEESRGPLQRASRAAG